MEKVLCQVDSRHLYLRSIVAKSYNFSNNTGASPSGKAAGFGSAIRRFESFRPSFFTEM